jgi:hypothetical protein
MEIILAIVVASAVIFFGALISMGNERQKKAIDGLREQVAKWAMQDLKIKRERIAREVRVDDPLRWLTMKFSKFCNLRGELQVVEFFDEPCALICTTSEREIKVVFSTLSLNEIQSIKKGKKNRLSQFTGNNPLLSLSKNVRVYEISVLSDDFLFDLELPIAWKGLTGQEIVEVERLWMYII